MLYCKKSNDLIFPIKNERVVFLVTAELLWKVFEATGSIAAYMFYRRMTVQ